MSKLSGVAMELDELSAELGYDGYLDAMADGYDWATNKDGSAYLYKIDMKGEMEKAHDEWLKEKHEVLHLLESIKEDIINLNGGDNTHPAIDDLDYVIDFVEKGEV